MPTYSVQASIVFSQRTWAGVGDLDDCWVISLLQTVHCCMPWSLLPTATVVRQAAGDPDDGVSDGGNLTELRRAALKLYPELTGKLHVLRGDPLAQLQSLVTAGHPASIAVVCDKLPARLRYGTIGAVRHQVTVAVRGGKLRFANPLAPMGSRWDPIAWADVLPAIRAYSGAGKVHALVLPTIDAMAPYYPGVRALVAAAHGEPDPAAIEAARAAGFAAGFADAKADASSAVAAIHP